MNYLFIDIECANCKDGGKLCEFGYVLTDQNLNELEYKNILINPDADFDPYVINKMLNFTIKEYKSSPKLNEVYDMIYPLLTAKDTIIVGHTVGGDAVHIGDDCVRYNLPTPDFLYVDVVELFKDFDGSKNATSLVKMCNALEIETDENVHTAAVDARLTMLVAKGLCDKKGVSFSQLIKDVPQCRGSIKNYAKTVEQKENYKQFLLECENNGVKLTNGMQNSNIRLFRKYVSVDGVAYTDKIKDKAVCLSSNFELTDYNGTLNLIQLIKNAEGISVSQPSKCDVFVKFKLQTQDKKEVYCKKLDAVLAAKERGKKVEIIELEDFITLLGVSAAALKNPIRSKVEKLIKERSKHVYSDQEQGATIGEVIKNKFSENN